MNSKLTFEEFVKQKVDRMVESEEIMHTICNNNFMVDYGIDCSIGNIYRNYNGAYIINETGNVYISEEYIRKNFNKEAYIKAVLNESGVFEMDKDVFYQEYKEDIL